jgi:hypothetical protein
MWFQIEIKDTKDETECFGIHGETENEILEETCETIKAWTKKRKFSEIKKVTLLVLSLAV